jgi:hypothetical protein
MRRIHQLSSKQNWQARVLCVIVRALSDPRRYLIIAFLLLGLNTSESFFDVIYVRGDNIFVVEKTWDCSL